MLLSDLNKDSSCYNLEFTLKSSSEIDEKIAFTKLTASVNQRFKAIKFSVFLVSLINCCMTVFSEFKSAEVCSSTSEAIVKFKKYTISSEVLLE